MTYVLRLLKKACKEKFPSDKGRDKRPEKGFNCKPVSPDSDTPQFSEKSNSSDSGEGADDQLSDAPGSPGSDAAAIIEERRLRAYAAATARMQGTGGAVDESEHEDDGSRSPSPCPVRTKRVREDRDAKPEDFQDKRSRRD